MKNVKHFKTIVLQYKKKYRDPFENPAFLTILNNIKTDWTFKQSVVKLGRSLFSKTVVFGTEKVEIIIRLQWPVCRLV